MQIIISQCISCGCTYRCHIDLVKKICSECSQNCIINSEKFDISHGYCNFCLAIHMRKFQPKRITHDPSSSQT